MQPTDRTDDTKPKFDLPAGAGDDLYINDGDSFGAEFQYYDQPEERKQAEQAQAAAVNAPTPLQENVAKWFEEEIAKCNLPENIMTRTVEIAGVKVESKASIEGQVIAYQMLKQLLTDKFSEFEKFIKKEEE